MSPHIQTPVEKHTGNVVGVNFVDGIGHTDSHAALAYFERHSYDVMPECPPGCKTAPVSDGGTGDTGKEPTEREVLVAEAKELGLDAKGKTAELKKRIADHKAKNPAPPENPPAGEDKGTGDGADGSTPADGDTGTEQSE